jgi:hypothetical protein
MDKQTNDKQKKKGIEEGEVCGLSRLEQKVKNNRTKKKKKEEHRRAHFPLSSVHHLTFLV